MLVYLVYDHIDYESSMVVAVFSQEALARDYARTADLYTDGRSISRAELDNPDAYPDQLAYYRTKEKDKF